MSQVLADRDIKKLIGTVILDTDAARINPNGIEIRLGKDVFFQSTEEQKTLFPGMYLKVTPGESVLISSLESFDFTRQAVESVFPGCDLMALVTPTTTMMREGIMQSATKVDAGWRGTLNWGLRNSSSRDFIIGYGEPIFKLTLLLLQGDELPEIRYGGRATDAYQDTCGIKTSTRTIPASIGKKQFVASSVEKLDPVKQLKESGYPFNHIGTELTALHGKFEIVSNDVALLKQTIADETKALSQKIDDSRQTAIEKVEIIFDRKFIGLIGRVVASISGLYGIALFLENGGLRKGTVAGIAIGAAVCVWLLANSFAARPKPASKPTATRD